MIAALPTVLSLLSPAPLGARPAVHTPAPARGVSLMSVPAEWKSPSAAAGGSGELRWKGTTYLVEEVSSLRAELSEKAQEASSQLAAAKASLKDLEMDLALEVAALKKAEQDAALNAAEREELTASLSATEAKLLASTALAESQQAQLAAAEQREADLDAAYAAEARKAASLSMDRTQLRVQVKAKTNDVKAARKREGTLAAELNGFRSSSIFHLLSFGLRRDVTALSTRLPLQALCQRLVASVTSWMAKCTRAIGAALRGGVPAARGSSADVPSRWVASPQQWTAAPKWQTRRPSDLGTWA